MCRVRAEPTFERLHDTAAGGVATRFALARLRARGSECRPSSRAPEDPPDAPRTKDFPGETFRVLKKREIKEYGEYRTKRLVLEAGDRLQGASPAPHASTGASHL